MLQVFPISDRVAVQRESVETKTPGGLFIPTSAQEKCTKAVVRAVGDGRLLENGIRVPPQVKVGDCVLLGRYAGTEVVVDNLELVIVNESEILAVIR